MILFAWFCSLGFVLAGVRQGAEPEGESPFFYVHYQPTPSPRPEGYWAGLFVKKRCTRAKKLYTKHLHVLLSEPWQALRLVIRIR